MPGLGVLRGISEGLLSDDRILSSSDKELLKQILHRARVSKTENGAIAEALARAVGEIISERASRVLGERIIDQLLRDTTSEVDVHHARPLWAGTPTPPPAGPDLPPAPHPPTPGPPGGNVEMLKGRIVARPVGLAADSVLLDEFLSPSELKDLTQFVLQSEMAFRISEVISPGVPGGTVDYEQRRSRVLMDTGKHGRVITDRLRAALPQVLDKLGVQPFEISRIEAQITASNQGDYFRWHTDDGTSEIASREVTFVYFFHREPKVFRGGELRIYEFMPQNAGCPPTGAYRAIVPEQNQMVVFRSSLAHEITLVECPTAAFADSRFTVNGWLHR